MIIYSVILTAIVLIVSIYVFGTLPLFIRKLLLRSPFYAAGFNFGVSFLLTSLMGAGMTAGFANLGGSILFALYCEFYYKRVKLPKEESKKANTGVQANSSIMQGPIKIIRMYK